MSKEIIKLKINKNNGNDEELIKKVFFYFGNPLPVKFIELATGLDRNVINRKLRSWEKWNYAMRVTRRTVEYWKIREEKI